MKSVFTMFFVLFAALLIIGYSGCSESKATPENPNDPSFETLLAQARMEDAKIDVEYERVVPDSLKGAMAEWIAKVVTGATNNLTTEDYEDTDDLVRATAHVAETGVWARTQKTIYLTFTYKGEGSDTRIKVEDLTPSQRKVFDYLNR